MRSPGMITGMPGGIGHDHHRQRAAHQLVDLHALDAAAHQALVGVGRPHRHLRQRGVHVLLRLGQVVVAVDAVHPLAQVLEPHPGVGFGMRFGQRRQHAVERRVGVVQILEVDAAR